MEGVLKVRRILVVDDEPDVVGSLVELLDACLVDAAPDFEMAQAFVARTKYDAAILDIMGVDGYRLLEICTKRGIPTMMLTAHALSPEHLVRSLQQGAHRYLPKDQMAEIDFYLEELIEDCERGNGTSGTWFKKLKPVFDKKFGAGWKQKHYEFWLEYEHTHPATKEELERML